MYDGCLIANLLLKEDVKADLLNQIQKGSVEYENYGVAVIVDGSISYSNQLFEDFISEIFDCPFPETGNYKMFKKKLEFFPAVISMIQTDNQDYLYYTDTIDTNNSSDNYLFVSCGVNDALENMTYNKFKDILCALIYLKQEEIDNNYIFDNVFDLLTVSDKDGKLIKTNSAIEKQFGISRSDAIGTSVNDLEMSGVLSKSITKEVLKTKKPLSLIQDTQTGHRLLVSSTPIFDSDGDLVKVFNISKDITTVTTLEEKLKEAEEIIKEYEQQFSIPTQPQLTSKQYVTTNMAMQKAIDTVTHIKEVDSTVLIEGETGVGKDVMAGTIHSTSSHKNGPFVKVNCGAIPNNLIESELFGYEKGAFTGALSQGKSGLVASAENGTLFLDEIGDLPLNVQVKLLELIQLKTYYPVGSSAPKTANIRIIAATNRNLKQMVADGEFRDDLYYRLNVIPLYIPPLRDRRSEIPTLTNQFLQKFCKQYNKEKHFSREAMTIIVNAPWPGNIRELENLIERLVVTTHSYIITENDIPVSLLEESKNEKKIEIKINKITTLKEAQQEMENALIKKALSIFPNKSAAANILGIHRTTISRKSGALDE